MPAESRTSVRNDSCISSASMASTLSQVSLYRQQGWVDNLLDCGFQPSQRDFPGLQPAQHASAGLQLELKDLPQPLEGRIHRLVERSFRIDAVNYVYGVICHVLLYPCLSFFDNSFAGTPTTVVPAGTS